MKMPESGHRRQSAYTVKTENLSYRIKCRYRKSGTKYILRGVTCTAAPGEVLAIAGPSGAGKTTLLEVLSGVASQGRISGVVSVNDLPMDVKNFRRVSGYVTQDDALFPLLTVEETLLYSAMLRLGCTKREAMVRVQSLLRELGLDLVAGSKVGSGHRDGTGGISGGERRRVSIGVDLVHDPPVLLLDEPTSGLDSASALCVVSLLKAMAVEQGKTIVLTIHQPGFRILELFDRVVLLSEGGVIHHGSLKLLETQLRASGHGIPRHVNVLEYAIDAMESLAEEKTSIIGNRLLWNADSDAAEKEQRNEEEEEVAHWVGMHRSSRMEETQFSYANSRCREVLILGQRFCKNIFRTKQLFVARTIQALVAGLALGSIFINADRNGGPVALQTRLGFFAFSLTFLLSSTTEGLPIFLQERRILMRETSRGSYRVSSYVISNTLIFLPFLLLVAFLYTVPVYWLVGLRREVDGFFYFSLVVWMVVLMANSFVACFSALVPNFIMGNSLIAGFMGSFFLFSGYFIRKNNIPKYWIFMHYMSLFKYPFEAFMINEYGGDRNRWRCVEVDNGVCMLSGERFIEQQGLKESQKWSNLGVMLSFICGYRLLCFLILWFRCARTRK